MIDGEDVERGKFCIDKTLQLDDVYVVRLCKNVSYCSSVNKNKNKEWCVHKCCNDGFQSIDYKCSLNDRMGIHVKNHSDVYRMGIHVKNHSDVYTRIDGYGMMYGGNVNCPRALWKEFSEVKPQIRADGILTIDNSAMEYKLNDYCLGTNYDTTTGQIYDMVIYCEFREALYVKWRFNEIATVITCIAFVLTIAIYVFVYQLMKLHEQLICCFCLVDLTFWVMYALRIFDVKFGKFCIPFAYVYYFMMISRLSWLNVLSFHIWRTTISLTPNNGIPINNRFYRRMVYYTGYACLVPLICTTFFIIGNKGYYSLGRFTPLVNKISCFIDIRKIDGNLGLLHLFIPATILILINIGLFIKTVRHFLHTKSNVNNFADSMTGHKKNIYETKIIIIKLALLMGTTWIYYVYSYINSIQNNEIAQNIGDIMGFANTFEGVYFLLIFAVNWKKVKKFLQKRNLLPRISIKKPPPEPPNTTGISISASTTG
ncbi:hypothetical protein QE152_g12791 [Popillia japonica]|uniref:G-protein coupled receptors family 2 profile 2 domain-containing protein n=1 Tax=Popillia japonica TaxID=7064 RepID=A0AAW1LPP6_POPJA